MFPGSVVPVHSTSQCKVRALILLQLIPVVAHPNTSIIVLLARVLVFSPDCMMMAASAGLLAAWKWCVCALRPIRHPSLDCIPSHISPAGRNSLLDLTRTAESSAAQQHLPLECVWFIEEARANANPFTACREVEDTTNHHTLTSKYFLSSSVSEWIILLHSYKSVLLNGWILKR